MQTSTLESSFLQAALVVASFKSEAMKRAQGSLLSLALKGPTNAAMMPQDVTNGSKSLAGCASGALIAMGLLECVGRVKSPHADAKGRKLNVLAIPEGRVSTVRAWLSANGHVAPGAHQEELLLAQ